MLNILNTVQSNCIYATVSEEWTDEGYEGYEYTVHSLSLRFNPGTPFVSDQIKLNFTDHWISKSAL